MVATAFSRQGRSEQATPLLEEAVKLDGGTATSLHQLALNYINQHDHDSALKRLGELTSNYPSNMAGHVTITTFRLAQRKYAEAIEAAKIALAIEPGHANLRNLLGVALTKAGDLNKAEQTFEDLVANDPSYAPHKSTWPK